MTLDTGAGYYSYLTNADSLNSSRGVYVQDLITTDLAAIITDQHLNPGGNIHQKHFVCQSIG